MQISEVALPAPIYTEDGPGVLPIGAIAVGGASGFYMLSEEPEYDLPVKVWGYFDVEGCEYEIIPGENTAPEGCPPWAHKVGNVVFM